MINNDSGHYFSMLYRTNCEKKQRKLTDNEYFMQALDELFRNKVAFGEIKTGWIISIDKALFLAVHTIEEIDLDISLTVQYQISIEELTIRRMKQIQQLRKSI